MGTPLHRDPIGTHGGGVCSPGTLRDSWGRALEMEHLSLWVLCEGNLEGRLLYWEPWSYAEKALETDISLNRGLTGETGRSSFTRDFERWMKGALQVEASLWGSSVRGTCRGAPLLMTPKDMLRLWKWMSVSIRAPLLGNMEERSFPWAFERRDTFLYLGGFLYRIWYVKKKPCNQAALSIGPCWAWRGSFTGTFERKRKCVSGFFFCGPTGHYKLSLGAIWNFS